jgi:hypothetical protein
LEGKFLFFLGGAALEGILGASFVVADGAVLLERLANWIEMVGIERQGLQTGLAYACFRSGFLGLMRVPFI